MSLNTFGHLFRVTTWGESHGPALGATVDGCPPGVTIDEAMLQHWLDKRRPGQNRNMTQRQEPDAVRILSGTYEGQTTGTPIQLMIENTDQRSRDYGEIARTFRPGHADLTYHLKYGLRDPRGGGRSSARETAARVAAGGVARAALGALVPGLEIKGYMVAMGELDLDRARFDWDAIEGNDFWLPDAGAATLWEDYLQKLRKDHDSAAARLRGSENADEIFMGEDGLEFGSNHAGGILGGISTGQEIVVRFAVKPTSSILTPRRSVTVDGQPSEVVTKGRHDPCVGIRAVPVAEAMMACVILDHLLLHRGQVGEGPRGRIG
jgi:chorismate synthase